MSNNLNAIMPKIRARGWQVLRRKTLMPMLVNSDYGIDARQKGSQVDVPVPVAHTAYNVTPSNTPPALVDYTPDLVQIPLDNWKGDSFHLTDKELVQIDRNAHYVPMQVESSISVLAKAVNDSIFAEYKGVFGFAGTPATTPFASDASAAKDLRKVLNRQLCPSDMRRAVLDVDADGNASILATFTDAEKVSDGGRAKAEGEIGRKLGFDWYWDHDVPTHTKGTGAGYVTSGASSVGATTIPLITGTGTILVGDVITFSGDTQTYAVTAGIAAPGSISISPSLQVAQTGGETVTLKGTHVVNLGFHRDAFAFANRPLAENTRELGLGSQILSMQDPVSGITLRLEVARRYKAIVWEFDILWGVKLVRPELAARLAG